MTENRIDAMFKRLRADKRSALILFVTAGFPDLDTTERLLPALEEAGADVIELGVPFSDPIADGPTIQKSSARALEAGATFSRTLDALRRCRERGLKLPVILFGAYNPFYHRGVETTARDAAAAGADGCLAADLPVEEADEFQTALRAAGLHLIFLAAPTTPDERLRDLAARASGFLYCIARKGVTGAESRLSDDTMAYVERIRRVAPAGLPLALGFGISSPDHVRKAAGACEGVVVGSALINVMEKAATPDEAVRAAARYARELAGALK